MSLIVVLSKEKRATCVSPYTHLCLRYYQSSIIHTHMHIYVRMYGVYNRIEFFIFIVIRIGLIIQNYFCFSIFRLDFTFNTATRGFCKGHHKFTLCSNKYYQQNQKQY